MARIRSVKPDFWDSPGTARASLRCRLFYIAMWNWADDWGIGDANANRLMAFAFPNDTDISAADYPRLRVEVSECFDTVFYEVAGRQYYSIPSWEEHQRTEKKARRANPGPDEADSPVNTRESNEPTLGGGLSDTQPRIPARGKGEREEGNRKKEEGNKNLSTSGERERVDALFESAWAHWPKKVLRAEARKNFGLALKKTGPLDLAATIASFGDAYAETTERQYVPALGVWLNKERWTDELPQAARGDRQAPTNAQKALETVAYFQQREQQQRGIEA